MNKIVQRVLYWFFPRRCALCGDVVAIGDDLCDLCRTNPRIGSAPCDKCGKDKSRCECKNAHNTPDYERIVAPFYYEGNVIKAVHRFKFSSRPELATGMGDEMAKTVIREYGGIKFDYITYVPMSEKRQKRRGYNQSLELARRISGKIGVPLLDVFYKAYENPPQRNQSARMRRANIFGAFDVYDGLNIEGKTFLIVDDVKTTGSTLSECAAVLDSYGAKKCFCVSFAIR